MCFVESYNLFAFIWGIVNLVILFNKKKGQMQQKITAVLRDYLYAFLQWHLLALPLSRQFRVLDKTKINENLSNKNNSFYLYFDGLCWFVVFWMYKYKVRMNSKKRAEHYYFVISPTSHLPQLQLVWPMMLKLHH